MTAEGIETPEQLAELRRLGCEFGQGFLFAKPAPFDRMVELLGSASIGGDADADTDLVEPSPADPRAA